MVLIQMTVKILNLIKLLRNTKTITKQPRRKIILEKKFPVKKTSLIKIYKSYQLNKNIQLQNKF